MQDSVPSGTREVVCALMAILLLAAAPGRAADDRSETERGFRILRNYTADDYAAGTQNWSITQDRRGVIYAGNLGGVLEFDGAWWRLIPVTNDPAIFSLATDADGRIVVGGINEIGYLAPDPGGTNQYRSLSQFIPEKVGEIGEIRAIEPVSTGTFFLGDTALLFWDGKSRISLIRQLQPGRDTKRMFRIGNAIYLWTPEGLQRSDGERLVAVEGAPEFKGRRLELVLPFRNGERLVALEGGELFVWDGDTGAQPFAREAWDWLKRNGITNGCILRDGRIVVTTERGGVLFLNADGALDEVIDTTVGLGDDEVLFAFSDRDGAVWFAMDNGIARVDAVSPLSVIDVRAGLRGSVISIERHRGSLYVGTSQGLFVLRSGGEGAVGEGPRPPTAAVMVGRFRQPPFALLSAGSDLLVGTPEGVFALSGEEARLVPGTAGLSVYALEHSTARAGTVLVGAREGLGRLRQVGDRWAFGGLIEGVPRWLITVTEARPDELWVGTSFVGVARVHLVDGGPAKVETFGKGEIGTYRVGDRVVFTPDTIIWSLDPATGRLVADPVLGRFGNGSALFVLQEDGAGNVWLNTHPPSVILHGADGKYRYDSRLLSAAPGREIQCIHADPDGVVWFGSEKGLARYELSARAVASENPAPLIRRVSAGPDSVLFGGTQFSGMRAPELETKQVRRLRFEYSAVSYQPGMLYQYRLDPIDTEWSPWTSEPFTDFTGLRESNYTLRVRTKGLSDQISREASYSFRVLPPWYRTPLAYALYALMVVSVLMTIFRLRHSALRRRTEILEATVAEQTVELTRTVEELRAAKREVEEKNRELEVANTRLRSLSLRDGLTGIANRRHLEETLRYEWTRSARSKAPVGFVLMDLDYFKRLNDTEGHHEGDECLRRIASFLESTVRRAGDLAARYGGEEFAIVLPSTDLEGAVHFAETLRSGIEQLSIPHRASARGVMTASFGVASMTPVEATTIDLLVEAADRALYRAKSEGRNRVCS